MFSIQTKPNMSLLAFGLLFLVLNCDAANILGVVFHTAYSHQVAFRPLWRELSLRGHKVTVLTTDPINDPNLVNLTEIDLSIAYKAWQSTDIVEYSEKNNFVNVLYKLREVAENVLDAEMTVPAVQELLNNKNVSFDLVIAEIFYPLTLAFAHKFDCPLVMAISADAPSSLHEMAGSFVHPFLHPSFLLPFDHPLNLIEKIIILVAYLGENVFGDHYISHMTEISRRYFGEDMPDLGTITNERASLFLFYLNPAFGNIRPMTSAAVPMGGGSHIEAEKPLPVDLKGFLDNATEGAIYFSLGSNFFSKNMPIETRKVIVEALSELPFKILWKFEGDSLDGLPENIRIEQWVPQQDVLRHPNLKAFVTQCGIQSIEEALSAHVPLVAMPKMGDQFHNAKRVVSKGMGLRVDFDAVTKEEFKEAILEVANNPKYRNRMKELDEFAKDQPMKPLEKAVWWIEYVLRYNDTQHLKGIFARTPFYHQIFDFDVLAVYTAVFASVILLLKKIIK